MSRKFVGGLVVLAALFILGLFAVRPAFASEVIDGENVTISEDINDDVYAFGETVIVDATIDGDLIAFAETVVINGEVTGDVIAAGATVEVNGTVGDDLRAAGYAVILGEGASIGDDVNAGGYGIEAESGSVIGGDFFGGAFQALIADVDGSVSFGGAAFELTGEVGGNATIYVDGNAQTFFDPASTNPDLPRLAAVSPGLTINDDAFIAGDLIYGSSSEENLREGAVGGSIAFERIENEAPATPGPSAEFEAPSVNPGIFLLRRIGSVVGSFIMLLIVGVLLQRFAPQFVNNVSHTMRTRALPSFGVGLLGYIGYFVLLGLLALLFFVVVLPLIFVGGAGRVSSLLFYIFSGASIGFGFVTGWVAVILVSLLLGSLLTSMINDESPLPFWSLVIGLAIVVVVLAVPLLGTFFLSSLVGAFGLGAVLLTAFSGQQAPVLSGPTADVPPTEPVQPAPAAQGEPQLDPLRQPTRISEDEALGAG